jgi:ribosomal-protein-alanine N-acetyltransferase
MSVAISAAGVDDVPAIIDIERRAFSDPWSARSFREALEHPAVFFVCARTRGGARSGGGQVTGYVVAWFVADEGEIANLAVDPSGWGSGTGRALLDAALEEGERRGAAAVFLEVRDSNARARRLYQSRHFEEVGRRRDYYQRPVEDAIVLRRMLRQVDDVRGS